MASHLLHSGLLEGAARSQWETLECGRDFGASQSSVRSGDGPLRHTWSVQKFSPLTGTGMIEGHDMQAERNKLPGCQIDGRSNL